MKSNEKKTLDQEGEAFASMSSIARTNFQLKGVWLLLARGAWGAFVLVELVVLLLTLVATRGQSLTICPFIVSCAVTPATAQALHHLALSPSTYAAYNLALAVLQSLVFLGVGVFIFWRKSNEPIGLVVSFFLVSIGLSPFLTSTTSTYSPAVLFLNIGVTCIFTALGYFLVTFPDGRFVPGWTWLLVVLWAVRTLFYVIPGPFNIAFWPPAFNAIDEVVSYGGALAVLVYRYVRVFSSSQRQQAKWLLFGFGGLFVVILLYDLIDYLVPGLAAPDPLHLLASGTLSMVTFLLIPLSVAMAILRARLWEIDVIIRRTLVYSTLTLLLVLLYWGLVLALGSLLHSALGQQQNPLVLVASTLLVAALVQPLRHGVQRVIDRRFYRRKYNATKIMAAFSARLRSEVDLDQVRQELLAAVQETMQPAHVSLWLRPPAREPERLSHIEADVRRQEGKENTMHIGILGTGIVGQTLGLRLVQLGHPVMLGTRDPAQLDEPKGRGPDARTLRAWLALAGSGASVGTFRDAAAYGELVISATSGVASLEVLQTVGEASLHGKTLLDTSNPIDVSRGFPLTLFVKDTDSLGEILQRAFPTVRLVKTLNTMSAALMVNPQLVGHGDHTVFVSGNDAQAKAQVAALLRELGWHDILDLGDIATARGTEMMLSIGHALMRALSPAEIAFKVVR